MVDIKKHRFGDLLLKLTGLTPSNVRCVNGEARLQWNVDGHVIETDFDRFRPVNVALSADRNALDVTWADFADLPLTDHFFKHSIDRVPGLAVSSARFRTTQDVLGLVADQPDSLPFTGVIFHMARTGSTLIHRLFSRIGKVHSVSEIALLDRALYLMQDWPEEVRNRTIVDLLGVYCKPRRPNERQFITKMTDAVASVRLPLFRAAFPAVPWIFVYRDPIEVMVSVLRKPTGNIEGWYKNRTQAATRLGMPRLADPSMWPEEFMARTLQRYCIRAVEAAKNTPKGLFLAVPYSRLPDAIWETIAPHFGIALSEADREVMRAEARYSAKSGDGTEFRPDSASKQDQATPYMHRLAEKFVAPAMQELLALPQA